MLGETQLVAFVPTRDPDAAARFYGQMLGLTLVSRDSFAVVFDANGVTLRVTDVSSVKEFKPHPFTVLGWRVDSAERAVRQLAARGVRFERYPGMQQDALGIWLSPAGAQVAWFKDPDGNVLSVTEF